MEETDLLYGIFGKMDNLFFGQRRELLQGRKHKNWERRISTFLKGSGLSEECQESGRWIATVQLYPWFH
jgi:hypothetical protein